MQLGNEHTSTRSTRDARSRTRDAMALDAMAPARRQVDRANGLRARLLFGDVVAAAVGWGVTWFALRSDSLGPGFIGVQTAVVVFMCSRQRLYLSRVCAVRAVEMALLGRVSFRSGLVAAVILWQADVQRPVVAALVGMILTFMSLALSRGAYRSVLMRARRDGRYLRPVVVVGTDEIGLQLVQHIGRNPAFGYQVVGVVGDAAEHHRHDVEVPYLGSVTNSVELALAAGANGTIVSAGAAPIVELNQLMRDLLDSGLHVQITPGLRGFAQHRVTTHDIAYEPLLYVEPVQLSKAQSIVKRALDLAIAPLVLLGTAPVFAAIAVAIRLTSHGPVLFRQERVGHNGRTFTILKFRTMVVEAEELAAALEDNNLRDGPLFKMDNDPRITRVGKVLRATSLDELPQLLNVLGGSMTLVGPRPALESEVAAFDDELLRRFSVRPGVTGLWQLEARDDPDFDAYRRLDLFYVENWSLSLDLAIIIGTMADVVVRGLGALTGRDSVN
jgi:exopolysaccharide biosynthesis polyprenyl glycosylphosphotransferase